LNAVDNAAIFGIINSIEISSDIPMGRGESGVSIGASETRSRARARARGESLTGETGWPGAGEERGRAVATTVATARSVNGLSPGAVDGGDDRPHGRGRRVGVDADAPVDLAANLTFDVGRGLGIGALGERVLGVVQHPDLDAHRGQRSAERGDRAVADALDL